MKTDIGVFGKDNSKYIRIFKDNAEIENNKNRLNEIDYMTLYGFKEE